MNEPAKQTPARSEVRAVRLRLLVAMIALAAGAAALVVAILLVRVTLA